MKKIKVFEGDTFEFHKKVVSSKHHRPTDPTYKERIKNLEAIIKEQFQEHDNQFRANNLASLSTKILINTDKNDLKSLYDYDTKPFQQLNDILTTGNNNTRQPLCPLCTVNNVNSFDHLIPKSEFAEFSTLPTNLMPCCSYCNSKKSANWRIANGRRYLNLYLDELPNVQFLFVNLALEDETIKVKFSVENMNHIEENLYLTIYNHYTDIDLCILFARNCDNTISELKTLLDNVKDLIPKETLKNRIIEIEEDNRKHFGFNYWKSILKIECLKNNDVFDFLLK